MKVVSKFHDVMISINQETVACNDNGLTQLHVNMSRASHIRLYFAIHLVITQRGLIWSRRFQSQVIVIRKKWDEPIKIASAFTKHGECFQPVKLIRVATSQAAPKYVNKMPRSTIFALCFYLENSAKAIPLWSKELCRMSGLMQYPYQSMITSTCAWKYWSYSQYPESPMQNTRGLRRSSIPVTCWMTPIMKSLVIMRPMSFW